MLLTRLERSVVVAASLVITTGLAVAGCGGEVAEPAPAEEVFGPNRGDANGDVGFGPTCCDSGCAVDERCLQGVCHLGPSVSGDCHVDSDCSAGQRCADARVCATCDASCEPQLGRCVAAAGCCESDAACEDGVCRGGRCLARSEHGRCWTVDDCGMGQQCSDGLECTCGDADCEPAEGICAVPGLCCASDYECGDGRCVAGLCQRALDGGECFGDSDCDGLQRCAGATVCGCQDAGCAVPTTPGSCMPAVGAACYDTGDCGGDLCVDGKACAPVPSATGCYLDDHCGPLGRCDGADLCTNGRSDCLVTPGSCAVVGVSCATDGECPVATHCVVPDDVLCPQADAPVPTGFCAPDLDPDQGCWSSSECGDGRCLDGVFCRDPQGCVQPNQRGSCAPFTKPWAGCSTHADCGPQGQCRNSNSVLTCPPNVTALCAPAPDGVFCSNTADCPDGRACVVEPFCPCGEGNKACEPPATCPFVYVGMCVSKAEKNCTTNPECGDGWTCVRDEDCYANPCGELGECATLGACRQEQPGRCWKHNACGVGEYCKGLEVCPVGLTCGYSDKAGECTPKEASGACCDSYFSCGDGLRCVSALGQPCGLDLTATCVPETAFNETCFVAGDCLPSRECVGQTVCPCGADEGCAPAAGTCELKAP